MRFEDSLQEKRRRHKGKWVMALIFGPLLVAVFIPLFALLGVSSHFFWILAVAVGGVVTKGADLLGRRFGLSAQEFSGPVAVSTVICAILFITLLIRFC